MIRARKVPKLRHSPTVRVFFQPSAFLKIEWAAPEKETVSLLPVFFVLFPAVEGDKTIFLIWLFFSACVLYVHYSLPPSVSLIPTNREIFAAVLQLMYVFVFPYRSHKSHVRASECAMSNVTKITQLVQFPATIFLFSLPYLLLPMTPPWTPI